jgi:hypothetical protein
LSRQLSGVADAKFKVAVWSRGPLRFRCMRRSLKWAPFHKPPLDVQ